VLLIGGAGRYVGAQEARVPDETQDPSATAENLLLDGLNAWQGVVGNPVVCRRLGWRARRLQRLADNDMRMHWTVEDGVLHFDGQGNNLRTRSNYGDFELSLDWKIEQGGRSGVYLRGMPQVQIWDSPKFADRDGWVAVSDESENTVMIGSGGLHNNRRHPSKPLVNADRPVGEWNSLVIRMNGNRVTVWLNGQKVVDDTVMENFWNPQNQLPQEGPIELQADGTPVWFRNIFIRPLEQE